MVKYLKRLAGQLSDEHNLAEELFLAWIAIMLTGIFVFMIVGYIFG